jgi:hypothetical protein
MSHVSPSSRTHFSIPRLRMEAYSISETSYSVRNTARSAKTKNLNTFNIYDLTATLRFGVLGSVKVSLHSCKQGPVCRLFQPTVHVSLLLVRLMWHYEYLSRCLFLSAGSYRVCMIQLPFDYTNLFFIPNPECIVCTA